MSDLTIRFHSTCLKRFTTFKMYIPDAVRENLPMFINQESEYAKRPTKTLVISN